MVTELMDAILPTKDGWVAPCFYGYVDWDEFCLMLNCPELNKPEFSDFAGRSVHAKEVEDILIREFSNWGKEELVTTAQEWRFPFGMVQDSKDVVNCPQLREREFFVELEHPKLGQLLYPGLPFKMSQTPGEMERAPLLGEHNEEIYCHLLGYTKSDLDKLREEGII